MNLVPTSLGKRVTEPHRAYIDLKNSVNKYLSHKDKSVQAPIDTNKKINVLGISTTNLKLPERVLRSKL